MGRKKGVTLRKTKGVGRSEAEKVEEGENHIRLRGEDII